MLNVLSGCTFNNSGKIQDNNNNKDIQTEKDVSKYQDLSINHNCIGCGRCIMVDSEHFSGSGREIVVVSSKNLGSKKLYEAIKVCPTSAIELS
ncbi:ferredoxin [bacterium]|nr:ferredoxin [bacterium]